MEQVLRALTNTIIDDTVKTFYSNIKSIIPNIFLLKSQTTNYFDFINSISDLAHIELLKEFNLSSINVRLNELIYYSSTQTEKYNQNLLMLWLCISSTSDIVIKNQITNNKLLILSIGNINKTTTTYFYDVAIIKYNGQISVIQMNKQTGALVSNGTEIEIIDVIKNILTN
jgi:hypothetical protein